MGGGGRGEERGCSITNNKKCTHTKMKVQEGRARNVHTQKCKYRKVERGRLGGEDVAMVACGAYHSCAITASGVCV